MPKIFEIYGYVISIWSNENGEPVHVHIYLSADHQPILLKFGC